MDDVRRLAERVDELTRALAAARQRANELAGARAAALQESMRDPLTGVLNRRGLAEVGAAALAGCRTSGLECAVVFVDVDGLKTVNDTRGHGAGDALLQTVAELLRGCFRGTDLVARVGGDEFVVLALDAPADPAQLVARLLSAAGDRGLPVSAGAVHASLFPGADLAQLVDLADQAMYAARAARRSRTLQG